MLSSKAFKKSAEEFITHLEVEKNLSPHTQRAYKSDLEQFIEFWQRIDENKKDQDETPITRAVERFLVFMYNEKISKSTIARKISCQKKKKKYLKINHEIDLQLTVNRPKTTKKLPIYLSVEEIVHLLDEIDPKDLPTKKPLRDIAVLELLYATGVRCSELVSICFNDIDLNNRTIRILGKGNKERIVLFGNKAKEKLTNYIENERAVAYNLQERIFLNNCSQPITVRTVQRIVEMFRQFLKIERPITPHKIRHSFATHMLNQGVPLRVVQELLGHKSLSSTEVYTHVTTTELKELCNTMHPMKSMNKQIKPV
mgnify:CR=1 FL=1